MDANAIESQTVGRGLGELAGRSVFAGRFFISMATLIYEVLLTRVFSVRMRYRFAFVAANIVDLRPRFPQEDLPCEVACYVLALVSLTVMQARRKQGNARAQMAVATVHGRKAVV